MMKKGFTLVEMLIVIAVIGVLAVAVLSAINPIEQMRKARDTRRKSNASELLNAVERFYATREAYPTAFSAGRDGTSCATALGFSAITASSLNELATTNELKPEFLTRVGHADNALYAAVDIAGGSQLVRVCYEIESDANIQKYSSFMTTGSGTACTTAAGSFACIPE